MPMRDHVHNDGREQQLHQHIFSLPQEQLQNNPQAILEAINSWIQANMFMMIYIPSKIAVSREILSSASPPPKTFVELGCYVGCSALAWGMLLKEYHGQDAAKKGAKVYTCEFNPEIAKVARDFVELAGLSDVVEIVIGTSTDSIRNLAKEGKFEHIDVLFLDHWEEYYLPDLQLVEDLGLLKKGSVILADNTDIPGAPQYLEYVQKGGRGNEGGVKIETKTYLAPGITEGPKVVEATKVIEVPNTASKA